MKTCLRFVAVLVLMFAALPARPAPGPLAQGIQLYEAKRYEEARKFFEAYATKNPKDAEAAFQVGRSLLALKKNEPAAEWLEKAAELAPNRSDVQLLLGRAYGRAAMEANVLRQPGLAKKTRVAWEKSVALDPNNLEAREDLIDFYLEAPGIMGGSVEKAQEQAAEITKRDPARGHMASANIALNQKDNAAAERELKAAVQAAPNNAALRMRLALFYQDQQKWEAAFETLEAALTADPNNWNALYQMGRTGAFSGKRLDRSEECLKRYFEHKPGPDDPPLANAHFRLGQIYEKKGNKALARTEYQTALKLDPKLQDAKDALAKL